MGFSWSYSKMKNYLVCPKRHYEVDLAKNFSDSSEHIDWGNTVHKGLAAAALHRAGLPAQGQGRDRVAPAPLPIELQSFEKWLDRYADPSLPGQLFVEQKYAITQQFRPISWFDRGAWYRGVCDLLRIAGPVARALDWKTGKLMHDSRQLMLMAQCIFAHHPTVRRIHTEFVWLKDNNFEAVTPEVFDRHTMMQEWPPVLGIVKDMEKAAATLTYPPKPNHFCLRNCPVDSCPYHKKRL